MASEKCLLKSLSDEFNDIIIWNCEPYFLGRSKETRIKDKLCSKQQLEIKADFGLKECTVQKLGANCSSVSSVPLSKGTCVTAKHGDVIEVLTGKYKYRIEFDSEPSDNCEETVVTDTTQLRIGSKGVKRAASSEDSNDIVPAKKLKDDGNAWSSVENGSLLICNQNVRGCSKIAAFDMDGTLITTKSGRVFPVDNNDWKIIFPEVPKKLQSMSKKGYKIVIFTNQAGIESGKQTVTGVQTKINNIMEALQVPIQVFVSTGKNKYRKPAPFMWEYLEKHCNSGVEVDRSQCIYVGDAAGRPASTAPKRKKDFSMADRLFASNLGVPFATPEEHFLQLPSQKFDKPAFDPSQMSSSVDLYGTANVKVPAFKVELIILCGFPGSGKSYFASTVLSKLGYKIANRDTLGSWQKCAALVEQSLKDGDHVVVDNTNPDKESRGRYIKIANQLKVPARCFMMNVSKDHARHNNKFRELTDSKHTKISDMIFNMYNSKYQKPDKSEGFVDVVQVNFKPSFKSKAMENLYKKFLLEK